MKSSAGILLVLVCLVILFGCTREITPIKSSANPAEAHFSEVKVEKVNYGGANGYLCRPDDDFHRYPGVVLTPGLGGLAEQARGSCQLFAKNGFVVLAIDGNQEHECSAGYEFDVVIQRTDAAFNYLENLPYCNKKIGLWGASNGAVSSIAYSTLNDRVKAVVAVSPIYTFCDFSEMYLKHMDSCNALSYESRKYNLSNIRSSVFIVNGEMEDIKDVLKNELETLGFAPTVESKRVPGGGHVPRQLQNEEIEFLKTHLN